MSTRPQGNLCSAWVEGGIITMEDGTQVDLVAIQATLNLAFHQLGDQEFASAADEMAKVTGMWQGPHGDFFESPD